jgi:hypothetical protein
VVGELLNRVVASFTSLHDVLNVLESVVIESAAGSVMSLHHSFEAFKVTRKNLSVLTNNAGNRGEHLESVISTDSLVDLSLKFTLSSLRILALNLSVQMVELNVARVDSGADLSLVGLVAISFNTSDLLSLIEDGLEEAFFLRLSQIQVSDEISNGLLVELHVSVSHDV